jgi:hypothetical protein
LPLSEVVAVDLFARLLSRMGLRPPAAHGRRASRQARKPGSVRKARGTARAHNQQITRVERSVTTTWFPSGRKKRQATSEWRHGTCPVRHRSEQAAARCKRS